MLVVTWATRHYKYYLYRSSTDDAALTYLHKFADNNKLMRWSLRLAKFDFSIEHRPVTKIKHVDALSYHVQTVTVEQTLSKDRVREEEKTDKFSNTLEVGKQNGNPEYFYDEKGVVYRRRKNA